MTTLQVADLLAASPLLALVVGVVMRAGLAYQRELTWPEYRYLHEFRRLLFPRLDAHAPLSLVNEKGGRTDGEYIVTLDGDVSEVITLMRAGGGSLHLLSSLKRRPPDHGDRLSAAHCVWAHADESQTEAFLFANDTGTTDVYVHHEPAVTDPDDHLGGDGQVDGDPRGVVRQALAEATAHE